MKFISDSLVCKCLWQWYGHFDTASVLHHVYGFMNFSQWQRRGMGAIITFPMGMIMHSVVNFLSNVPIDSFIVANVETFRLLSKEWPEQIKLKCIKSNWRCGSCQFIYIRITILQIVSRWLITEWDITRVLYFGPRVRYVKLWVAHAPGTLGTFSPPPRVSDPDIHHGTCHDACWDSQLAVFFESGGG